jgi:hypothetical protein
MENGLNSKYPAWQMQFAVNDTVTIAVNANGKVEYKYNGVIQDTSKKTIQYPLLVDCSFYRVGGAAKNVKWV